MKKTNGIIIAGIGITSFPESKTPDKETATLQALYPYESVDSPKFKRKSVGRTTDVSFGKQALFVNTQYAHELIDSRAFVSDKEYELEFQFNAETMDNEIVKLIPVDPALKEHFKSMGMK